MTLFARAGLLTTAAVLLSGGLYAREWDKILFLEADGGYGVSRYNKSGDLFDVSEPDKYGAVFGAGLGYRLTDNHFMTLNYQRNALDSVTFDNVYLSANFRFRFKRSDFAPYAGVLAGMSTMHWSTPPVKTEGPVEDSTAFLWGFRIGDEYLLSRYWQLYGAYQYMNASHKTYIAGRGSVEYTDTHMLIAGIRFSFIDP
jgi:opacity protein-like surface antigen